MELFLFLVALELPALVALLDAANRPVDHFEGGADDKRSWVRWNVVGVATAWCLVGNGVVLAYYHVVVRRNGPMAPG